MNTYLVRTTLDHTLIGVFCAASPKALATIIDETFDARDCEFLALATNEGLFIEARFVTQPAADGKTPQVFLTNVDEPLIVAPGAGADEELSEYDQQILEELQEGYIPPVLEPTQRLHQRLQRPQQWQALVPARATPKVQRTAATSPPVSAPAQEHDRLVTRLMQGALNPASFVRNPSTRTH